MASLSRFHSKLRASSLIGSAIRFFLMDLIDFGLFVEGDYDFGYSCGSEVYQSLTGAQLWSPSKTSRVVSNCGTPTKQLGRGSTPTPDASLVPSYYLRSLSPPPVVDHYSSSVAVSEPVRRDRSSSKGGIARLFAGKESKRKKSSGTVSEGEIVASPARSLSATTPKSPLKTALGMSSNL